MTVLAVAALLGGMLLTYAAMRLETLRNADRFVLCIWGSPLLGGEAQALISAGGVLVVVGDVCLVTHLDVSLWWGFVPVLLGNAAGWAPAHRHNVRLRLERAADDDDTHGDTDDDTQRLIGAQ